METCGFEVRTEQGKELKLAMQRLWLTGQILPAGARLLVRHEFSNGEDQALEAVYAFMLPRDAALRRFEVEGEGFKAHSELRRVEEAVKEYEKGIAAGHLATLARSYRDGVINLTLGNLRKSECVTVTLEILCGVELRDDGLRFRFPFTLAPGYHPKMRAISLGARGELELPQEEFGDVILPPYMRKEDGLHEAGFDLALRIPGTIAEIGSPSHAVRMREEHGTRRVTLAPASDVPNRDLVLDVRVADSQTQVLAGNGHFAILAPSTRFGTASDQPRRIAMVIDRSGSMQGLPMTQARRAVEACLGALSQSDQFALAAFDDQTETFRDTLTPATAESRSAARVFLQKIKARGGTELAQGFSLAARMLQGGGDVLIITDGQVMGTEEILAQARALNVRIHCLGIGSASQDRFLALLASSTGGVSRFVTPQERVDVAAVDLFASIGRPVAVEVHASGGTFELEPPHTVFAGTPWIAFGEIPGSPEINVAWLTGQFSEKIPAGMPEVGETVRLLAGARLITDIESRMTPALEKEMKPRLAQLSERYGLASKAMALVAVIERAGDRAGAPPVTRVAPLGMPRDTSFDSYFPGAAAGIVPPAPSFMASPVAPSPARARMTPMASLPDDFDLLSANTSDVESDLEESFSQNPVTPSPEDRMLEIAGSLEPDGGLVGKDVEDRALKTVIALLFLLEHGHTTTQGAFRAHVERMVRFLENTAVPGDVVRNVIAFARAGRRPAGEAIESWKDVEAAIA